MASRSGSGHYLSRRALMGTAAVALGCGRRKGTGYAGLALIANEASRSVAAVDLTRFRVAGTIGLDAEPSDILAPEETTNVYALTPRTGMVHEIDPVGLKRRRSARAASSAVAMRLAPDGRSLWLLCREPRALVEVALTDLRPARRINLPETPADFDLSVQGEPRAAIAIQDRNQIAVANLGKGAVERMLTLPAPPSLVRFRKDGRVVLAGHRGERALSIVEADSGRYVVRLPLALEAACFCAHPDGGQVFITGPGLDGVVILYPYQTEVGETLLSGRSPAGMAIAPSAGLVFIANPPSGEVSVLEIATRKLIAVVAVGSEPAVVVITPDDQYALVMNRKSGDVAVIRVAAVIDRRTKMAPLFTMIPVGSKPVAAAVRRV